MNTTGITQQKLDEEGVPFSVAFPLFRSWILSLLKSSSEDSFGKTLRPLVFVGHNCRSYDVPVFNSNIQRFAEEYSLSLVRTDGGSIHWFRSPLNNGTDDVSEQQSVVKKIDMEPQMEIDYYFLDSLLLFRQKELWLKTGSKSSSESKKIVSPKRYNLGALYEHLTGSGLENGHNAVYDVRALEALFLSEPIKDQWKDLASNQLFV